MSIQLESAQVKQADAEQTDCGRNFGKSLDSVSFEGNKNGLAEIKLLENGMILTCSKAASDLLGFAPSKLTRQPISRLLPQLGEMSLIVDEKINPCLRFLSIAGHRFEVIGMNGVHFASELFFSVVEEFGKRCLKITIQPIRQCQPTTLRHLRAY
jgi:hypothetical protein